MGNGAHDKGPAAGKLGHISAELASERARRIELEDRLRGERSLASALFDTAGALMVVLDSEGRIIRFNRACQEITHYTTAEVEGKRVWDLFLLPEEAEGVQDVFGDLKAGLSTNAYENYWLTKEGDRRRIAWSNSVLCDGDGQVAHVVAVGIDVTDREQSEARIQAILETAVDGVVVADENGIIESFNLAAERIFGYGAGEVLGRNVRMLMPEPYRSQHDGYIADYLRTEQPRIIGLGREVVGRRKDGDVFPMDLAVSEFHLVGRRMFTGIVRDITERKRLEEQLLQSSKLASLGELVGGIAHEINNPTGIIVMRSAGLMQEAGGQDLPEDMVDDIEVIQRQSDKIAQITSGLLAFSRQAPFSPHVTDVNRMVTNAVALVVNVLKSRDIASRLELDLCLPPAVLDPTRIEQVLLNLLNNAMDAMADGGELVLGTATVVGKEGQRYVKISVGDTGARIREEDLDRIFNPFFTTKEVGKGTGLGLSISYGIVQEHGGRLEVESRPGEGATFHIVLPLDASGVGA